MRGEFYLTAPVVDAYARCRAEVIRRLRDSRMTISYHFRPPHPAYRGFDAALRDLDRDSLRATLRDYETCRLELGTGGLDRDQPGGYADVKQVFGAPSVAVSALANPQVKTVLLGLYREWGAQMTRDNDFSVRGGPSWNAISLGPGAAMPRRPPYDLATPDRAEPRPAESQAAIWRAYEERVAYAAQNLAVVTSTEILRRAQP